MQEGTVFKEYWYTEDHVRELDPGVSAPMGVDLMHSMRHKPREPIMLTVDNLKQAIRAELVVEYWGGHIGTSGQRFMVNNKGWRPLPQTLGTPTDPECYYRTMLGACVEFPLEWLIEGENKMQFTAGPQMKYNFNWGFFFLYAFAIRVYYRDCESPYTGRVVSLDGLAVGDHPRLAVDLRSKDGRPAARVDFIGMYRDFDWRGTGLFHTWQYQTIKGALHHHVGSILPPVESIVWNTEWIADQEDPVRIVAGVQREDGLMTILEGVSLRLQRASRSVRMFPATAVPERFGVRVGQRMQCLIPVHGRLDHVARARLLVSSWSGAHGDATFFNSVKVAGPIGLVHDYSFDWLEIPVDLVQEGLNVFEIYADTEHHAYEVNWPGPALFLEYRTEA